VSTVLPPLAPDVSVQTLCSAGRIQCHLSGCGLLAGWSPAHRGTPGSLEVPLIPTLQWIKHIYRGQLCTSISECVGVGGRITINRIGKDLAFVAAAAVCPIVDCIAKQVWPTRSQASSGSHGTNESASE